MPVEATIHGELGVGSMDNSQYIPTAVKNIKGSEILTLSSSRSHSVLITKKGQTFGCGHKETKWAWYPKIHFYLNNTTKGEESCPIENRIQTNHGFNRPKRIVWVGNIAQLYNDDDSKDFKILVNIEDQKEEENKDKDVNYEEIPVHKFILLARSGLFRAMFDYVNEKDNTNKVQDYTNKSIESLKILIKYLYTNSIELTTEQDPKLIV
ncbi:btk-binding protein-related [Anaeramoeba flamelloides]|uniref:Btk-binding protein-related n=1 Tax=Anaeramoeba flamelloides TaxID=1746091 RepID=A0AAV7YAK6_9EUKA|nr:btk-binding protein-related [Anaeramoeba flamelloides]